ncbi:hypothetical protein C2845_PM05G14160 [Panicum miliaceum]|uniref:Uncharacterized protein n=1 Tax=Panicum miliaceum TaxID=4540 RepID=A0A3L6T1X0_PANMI|nr:hypothetical protein C2845_PM05G14160 [Panicum miliaceum]
MPASPPLTVLLLAAAVLLAASASDLVAADKHGGGGGGGRMVIIRAPRATNAAAGGARSRWQRRLDDEVAPEFGSGLLLGADQGRYISYGALNKDKPACDDNCAAPGDRYRKPPCKASDLVAADKHGGGGRMVIIRAPWATSAGARSRRQRRLEDEVAPEFGGGLLLGADQGRYISYGALNKNRPACGNRWCQRACVLRLQE